MFAISPEGRGASATPVVANEVAPKPSKALGYAPSEEAVQEEAVCGNVTASPDGDAANVEKAQWSKGDLRNPKDPNSAALLEADVAAAPA